MTSLQLLETILYDPKDGVFLLEYHCDRMINSAKELAPFFADNQETFLRDLIPTPSEISNKLDVAIKNAGKDTRQRPTLKDNVFLRHKTTERVVYNEARERQMLGPITTPTSAGVPFDAILYNEDDEIMETSVANIAIEIENPHSGELEWITPPLSSGLLCGTMRRSLIEKAELREQVITVDDLRKAVEEGRRIKCFNSIRKEFPVTVKL
ncbi:hypothetical protein EDD11_000503 [Mortierella claussenii]|nr:hypothetical protein EDD11_000503 [Mortierella claussenii]